jgi:hypothetical protein
MPVFASRSVFVVGRTAPAILTQTPVKGDLLVYDDVLGAFKNVPAVGTGGNGAINIDNTGTGYELASAGSGPDGATLNVKTLAAGSNITLTDDGQTITINSTGGSGGTNVGVLYKMLDFNSGTTDLITLPAGAIIISTEIAIGEAFDGAPTLYIGTDTTQDLLVDNSEVDLTASDTITYKDDVSFIVPGVGNQDIKCFLTPNGATQGQISIFIEYTASSSTVPVQNASVVNTITDRDLLLPVIGQFAYVLDDGSGEAALYLWIGSSWMLIGTQDSADVDAHTLFSNVDYTTSLTPILLGNVGANTHVTEVNIEILTPFNGSPLLSIGSTGNPTLISDGSGVNFAVAGIYTFQPDVNFVGPTDTPVYITFDNGGSTFGAANINISYL